MRTLTLDIVDYPGEWLLDLPLLSKSYEQWSAETIVQSKSLSRRAHAGPFHGQLAAIDPRAPADESKAIEAARDFTAFLAACRGARHIREPDPAGPVFDAGRTGRLAGADLRAA